MEFDWRGRVILTQLTEWCTIRKAGIAAGINRKRMMPSSEKAVTNRVCPPFPTLHVHFSMNDAPDIAETGLPMAIPPELDLLRGVFAFLDASLTECLLRATIEKDFGFRRLAPMPSQTSSCQDHAGLRQIAKRRQRA
jgi:hypothetical protein